MALTSPFALLFTDLIARLTDQVPELRHIDLDWNQLSFQEPPISYPAAIIDFGDTQYQQMQGFQKGDVTLTIKLVYRSFTATTSFVPETNRETALQFFELEQKIYEALQAWYGGTGKQLVNAYIRQNATTEKRDDGLRVRVLTFLGSYYDNTVTG